MTFIRGYKMTLLEALLSSRKYYKTDKNYIFTIDKPSPAKAAVVGGAAGALKGLIGGQALRLGADKLGKTLGDKAPAMTGIKKRAIEVASKVASKTGGALGTRPGKYASAALAIPLGAMIGHAMAKRKLKHADPYEKGIIDKVKGQQITGKQYRSLLKGQQAIGVNAHRLFPRTG